MVTLSTPQKGGGLGKMKTDMPPCEETPKERREREIREALMKTYVVIYSKGTEHGERGFEDKFEAECFRSQMYFEGYATGMTARRGRLAISEKEDIT